MIWSIFSDFLPYILGAVGLAAAWITGRSSGKKSAEHKHTKATLERTERIDDAIHGDSSNLDWRERVHNRNK